MEALSSENARNLIEKVQREIEGTKNHEKASYPKKFAEIIRTFQTTKDKVIKVKDDRAAVMLEVEFDDSLPNYELRLRITRDARSSIAKILRRGDVSTEIYVFTETGYRTASEANLDGLRYKRPPIALTGANHAARKGQQPKPETEKELNENPYSPNSYVSLSAMIRKFHDLLAKSSKAKLQVTQTV